jgi:phosphoribosylglycinamide formyltransferase-1
MKRIAIFASGKGSNAEAVMNYFKNSSAVKVTRVISNKNDAPVLAKAKSNTIPLMVVNKKLQLESQEFIDFLLAEKIDLIVLAGFLLLLPAKLVNAFHNKIINIHPALLPKYGGKGMYGTYVHEAVIKNREKESGITIHYVNEHFDEGEIIFQATCNVDTDDTAESLQKKINLLELEHYPSVIEKLLLQ